MIFFFIIRYIILKFWFSTIAKNLNLHEYNFS